MNDGFRIVKADAPRSETQQPQEWTISVPPTANHIWKIVMSRIIKDKVYRDWLAYCADLIEERMEPVDGPVRIDIVITLGKGFASNRDLDNCIKPVLDLLKPNSYSRAKEGKKPELKSRGAGVIEDDSVAFVREIRAYFEPPIDKKSDAFCTVRVTPLQEGKG